MSLSPGLIVNAILEILLFCSVNQIRTYNKADAMGILWSGKAGLQSYRDFTVFLWRLYLYQYCRADFRHSCLMARFWSKPGKLRLQGASASGTAGRHSHCLYSDSQSSARRHLRPAHSGCGAGIPEHLRPSPDRSGGFCYLVPDFPYLCGNYQNGGAGVGTVEHVKNLGKINYPFLPKWVILLRNE